MDYRPVRCVACSHEYNSIEYETCPECGSMRKERISKEEAEGPDTKDPSDYKV